MVALTDSALMVALMDSVLMEVLMATLMAMLMVMEPETSSATMVSLDLSSDWPTVPGR